MCAYNRDIIKILIWCLCCFFVLTHARTEDNAHRNINLLPLESCGIVNANAKINGENKTGVFEFPWMALIAHQSSKGRVFRCGGTIINRRYILTAAHCISDLKTQSQMSKIGVRIGEHHIQNKTDCKNDDEKMCASPPQDIGIEEAIPHPHYDKDTIMNDIGLLRLKQDINLTSSASVRAICLPTDDMANYNFTNRHGVVTGWGWSTTAAADEDRTKLNPDFVKNEVPFVPNEECRETYNATIEITEKQLCAGGRNNMGSCYGAGDGPIQVVESIRDDMRFVQQGVLSFGPRRCELVEYPEVYTRVSKYIQWILDSIKE